jgi:hypothetical protein
MLIVTDVMGEGRRTIGDGVKRKDAKTAKVSQRFWYIRSRPINIFA